MICKICFKNCDNYLFNTFFNKEICICYDCFKKLDPKFYSFKISEHKALSIYEYSGLVKELLFQLKGCHDFELGNTFFTYFSKELTLKFKKYIKVLAPSYIDDDKERGFNHVDAIFENIKIPKLTIIHKTKKMKQVGLKKSERKEISKHLIIDKIDLKGKRILLCDDVITTGSTINACIKLLEEQGAKEIFILTMAKRVLKEKGKITKIDKKLKKR